MSRIAIIGATGRAGSQLLQEALRRGHNVTAISRNASVKTLSHVCSGDRNQLLGL